MKEKIIFKNDIDELICIIRKNHTREELVFELDSFLESFYERMREDISHNCD
jgi:predicted site-specific integrase-resolvase